MTTEKYNSFSKLNCTILTEENLKAECESVDKFNERFYVKDLVEYLKSPNDRMGMLLFGARRTGKSVSIFQAIKELNVDYDKVMYLECNSTLKTFDVIDYLIPLYESGKIKYLFIDEATLISDVIEYSNYLIDRFNRIKVVLSGSSSFVFMFGKTKLLGRCHKIYPTYISFKEWKYLGMGGIWDYVQNGGVLLKPVDRVEYLNDFVNNNIQYSLKKYLDCSFASLDFYDRLENLIELYPRFVIKVTELFTNEFTLEKLKIKFKSKISGNRDLNNYLIEELNLDYSVDSITATDIEFLADLLVEGDFYIRTQSITKRLNKTFTRDRYCQVQPCLRYEQFRKSVDLIKDKFPEMSVDEVKRNLEGFILEDIVRLNIYKFIKIEEYSIYSLRIDDEKEVDVVVEGVDKVFLIEVKRHNKYKSSHCKWLVDNEVENRFIGKNIKRFVVNLGETKLSKENGREVNYVNIEDFLENLEIYLK